MYQVKTGMRIMLSGQRRGFVRGRLPETTEKKIRCIDGRIDIEHSRIFEYLQHLANGFGSIDVREIVEKTS